MNEEKSRVDVVLKEQSEIRNVAQDESAFANMDIINGLLTFNVLCQISITLALIYEKM